MHKKKEKTSFTPLLVSREHTATPGVWKSLVEKESIFQKRTIAGGGLKYQIPVNFRRIKID